MDIGVSIPFIGLLLIFIGFILIFIGILKMGSGAKGGGIILIGPIPIVWGSDRSVLKWMLIIGIVFLILYFIFAVWLMSQVVVGG